MKTPAEHLAEELEDRDFYPSLLRWARWCSWTLGRTWDIVRYAEDLVQKVIADLLDGTLSWDPDKIQLTHHLRRAIRSQVRHHREHVRRFRLESLEDLVADIDDEQTEKRERAHEAADALHRLAADDLDVLIIVDAIEQGDEPAKAIRDPLRYKAACVRMRRMAKSLPARLGPHCQRVISKKRQRSDRKRLERKPRRP